LLNHSLSVSWERPAESKHRASRAVSRGFDPVDRPRRGEYSMHFSNHILTPLERSQLCACNTEVPRWCEKKERRPLRDSDKPNLTNFLLAFGIYLMYLFGGEYLLLTRDATTRNQPCCSPNPDAHEDKSGRREKRMQYSEPGLNVSSHCTN